MAEAKIEKIAQAFVGARRAQIALSTYPGELPSDLVEAYQIQDRAIELAQSPALQTSHPNSSPNTWG